MKARSILLLLVSATFFLHIGWMFYTGTFHMPLDGDEPDYRTIAHNLASGFGYMDANGPNVNRFPLYPIFLSFCELLFGPSPEVVRVLQALMAALGVPLIWYIGTVAGPAGAGWLAALLYAVNPFVMHQTRFLMAETLTMLLLLALGAVTMKCTHARSHVEQWILLLGIICGLCLAARAQVVLSVLILVPWLCAVLRGRVPRFKVTLLVVAGILLVLSPWIARNYLVYQQFIPFTSGKYASAGGHVFWTTNNVLTASPGPDWGQWVHPTRLPEYAEYDAIPASNPSLADRNGYEYGLRFLSSHPELIPGMEIAKARIFWNYTWIMDAPGDLNMSVSVLVLVLVPFVLIGLLYEIQRPLLCLPFLAIVGAVFVSCLIYWGYARFRVPIEPYMTLMLAFGLSTLVTAFSRWRTHVYSPTRPLDRVRISRGR